MITEMNAFGSHIFRDRSEAGKELCTALRCYCGLPSTLVLALPRGGVPIGVEVARCLDVEFDILVVRKLGLPGMPEFAMGAIGGRDFQVLNGLVVANAGITAEEIRKVEKREREELIRREDIYRKGRPAPVMKDRTVLLVDDGLATGFTMRAAIMTVREEKPAQIVVAVPVSAPKTVEMLDQYADRVISLSVPADFQCVGQFYGDFSPVSDEEVLKLMYPAEDGNFVTRSE